MSKVIALGDTHGRSAWKEITLKEDADLIIFMGDYFDTHGGGYSGNRQIENFKDIVAFKKANMQKVILLIGNHDFHYMKGVNETYSKYQLRYALDIEKVLQEALDEKLIQMCFTYDKYIFTHAGVTKTWLKNALGFEDNDNKNLELLEKYVNEAFTHNKNLFKFTMGDNLDQTGDDITQSPIWVRPMSLHRDKLSDVVYVVGHTPVTYIDITKAKDFNIILIDALGGHSPEYLIFTDDVPSVGKI
jgi:predicted phosphodiesterase